MLQKNQQIRWSHNIAYAVGLVTTDGSLSKDGRHIILVSKDIEQIKTFKNCLGLKNKIGIRGGSFNKDGIYYHIQPSKANLYRWLENIGLSPNKTKTISNLDVPRKYFFDFLRGHIDGDGCFYSFWDKRWKNSFMFYTVFMAHRKEHIEWLRDELEKLLGIKGSIGKTRSIWQLKYAKKESRMLIPKMYYKKKLPCLKRKREKIENILKIDKKVQMGE